MSMENKPDTDARAQHLYADAQWTYLTYHVDKEIVVEISEPKYLSRIRNELAHIQTLSRICKDG